MHKGIRIFFGWGAGFGSWFVEEIRREGAR